MDKSKILIVEDEAIIAKDLQWRLESIGYNVPHIVSGGKDAIEKVRTDNPDLVLMDIMIKGEIDGIEAAEQIRAIADIPVIYLTAYADEETLERAKVTEPYGYLIKPAKDKELHSTIKMALYKHQMERELRENREWLSTVLNSISDGVIIADAKGTIRRMNPVAERLTGLKQEETTGNSLKEVFNIRNKEAGDKVEESVIRGAGNEIIAGLMNDTTLISRDGTLIPVNINTYSMKDEQGNVYGIVSVFRKITG